MSEAVDHGFLDVEFVVQVINLHTYAGGEDDKYRQRCSVDDRSIPKDGGGERWCVESGVVKPYASRSSCGGGQSLTCKRQARRLGKVTIAKSTPH